jgi:CheY-like chemotaxis protein
MMNLKSAFTVDASSRRKRGKAHVMTSDARAEARPLSILYVDDHAVSRLVARHLLESMGHAVCEAASGAEAIERLAAGRFDVLLTDIHMPGMDGFGLLERVRADHTPYDLPMVAVTADVMGRTGDRFRELGFAGVIAKPLLVPALAELLVTVTAPPPARAFAAVGMSKAR